MKHSSKEQLAGIRSEAQRYRRPLGQSTIDQFRRPGRDPQIYHFAALTGSGPGRCFRAEHE
ncbi:MAG: hypothetical protein IT425_05310 [Pirellulales bacterium]|nr:hypothetical protein [Pirellulales bacterium]